MIRPDDETEPFIARWQTLMRILLVDPSVKHVGRAAADYADYADGRNCHPSNERLARDTGYSERTIREAWATLRDLQLAERIEHGVPSRKLADRYNLIIPGHWKNLPVLGPNNRPFRCLNGCGKDGTGRPFNPRANSSLDAGRVRFRVQAFTFCPEPRTLRGRAEESCYAQWSKSRAEAGLPSWDDLANAGQIWQLFREARGDDW